ncbi:hypothetical protein BIY22_06575 [Vibrio panuliri]|uniref:Nitrate/nitrite sensing protein domain-containing protein n=1 Tax=Vibrio panuliri TaxID=1381081 RepID=A0A1Q9HK43_9VIBR|nr:hypothetical protein [Vibrio panuliri]OLQ90650.1 hypothetical protein BIY22_06575 [Vibrio panuliri]
MFVIASMSVSILILVLIYHYSRQRSQYQSRNYQQIVSLRLVMELCRQHRALTHQGVSHRDYAAVLPEVKQLEQALYQESGKLIGLASFDNKPMYRVLQLKLKGLGNDWQQRTSARNQRIHGTAIRHCMFLIDDIALTWLIESGRADLSDEYHINWQQILDSMEVLTQLRICIQEADQPIGEMRIKYYGDKIRHKLHQLSLISPLPIRSPMGVEVLDELDSVIGNDPLGLTQSQLYNLTTHISQLIAQVYDDMLAEMTHSLYKPLPEIDYANSATEVQSTVKSG